MSRLWNELKGFWASKSYVIGLSIVTLCAYGYAVTHQAIGMDDTVIPLYFEEGLAPYVGRWSLFVINKIFHIADFIPWMTELVSVMILMLSVTLWCILWKRICEPRVSLPTWSYLFVAAVFLSCPLISEVFVFYLHNGICLGYGVTALAVLCFVNSLKSGEERKRRLGNLLLSAVLLTIALGFYESFVMVYIMGAVTCFFLIHWLYDKKDNESLWLAKLLPWLGNGLLTVLLSVVMRFVILKVLSVVYNLERLSHYDVLYRQLFGDIFVIEGELAMVLKRFFVKYYVNGIVYLPITVLVLAIIFIGLLSLYGFIRKKDFILPVCCAALVLLPVGMSLVEGLDTRYRTAQYVPLVCAFAVLLILIQLYLGKRPKWLLLGSYFLLSVLIYNQCTDMNKWFYVDYMKYQDARSVMNQIAYDLEKHHDISKPLIFTNGYEVPYEICKDVYVSYSSPEYRWICRLTDPIDPHLKEKYFSPMGFCFGEGPIISVLQWGVTAFDGTSQQLIEFWKMHGHDAFRCETDLQVVKEAEEICRIEKMPAYPQNGYIKECENYIIVNLSE